MSCVPAHHEDHREAGVCQPCCLQLIPLVGHQQPPPSTDRPGLFLATALGKNTPWLLPIQEEDVNTDSSKAGSAVWTAAIAELNRQQHNKLQAKAHSCLTHAGARSVQHCSSNSAITEAG